MTTPTVMTAPSSRPTAVRLGAAVLAVLVAVLIPASPAWAHNSLKTAVPAQDATLPSAPTAVTLEFMQRLDPAFTTIVLTDAAKRKLPTGAPVVTGAKSTVQVTDTLPNGTYTVAYRVVSVDGHPVQGSYPFTVADPTSSAAPVANVSASGPPPSAAAAKSGGGPSAGVLVAGAALALLVLATAGLLWRRAARPDQP
ncbi:copper resistance CopC family protein [Micromonospora vinacea]|uniref:Methionine-rich copper-binding protein CopC n=1 Tax=Micromonospora vinacea TaxID=709878 RepID=A0ABS0KAD8_9ACTN|nr:copper resistance CopC family protein [Micromonospora vinacea]MBG6105466.1 methionine-rich copper-binding protein CopC [Micromonospora vinacea]